MSTEIHLEAIVEAFRIEASDLIQSIGEAILDLERSDNAGGRQQAAVSAFRHAHNLKGAAATLDFGRVEQLVHALEELLAGLREGELEALPDVIDQIFAALDVIAETAASTPQGDSTLDARERQILNALHAVVGKGPAVSDAPSPPPSQVQDATSPRDAPDRVSESQEREGSSFVRISKDKLDVLLGQLSELSEIRIRLQEVQRRVKSVDTHLAGIEGSAAGASRQKVQAASQTLEQEVRQLAKTAGEIQDELFELHMVPVHTVSHMLQRAVRDVARKRRIEVDLTITGGDYELDRKIMEELKAPLLHLLRNAVDHGIEAADERLAAGKPKRGSVGIRVLHQGNAVRIGVQDDGRGVDFDEVRRRAADLNLIGNMDRDLSQADLLRFLFASGFSTSKSADSVSGRGVGLDAVRRTVERLGGSINVRSEPGRGTEFDMTLPLTLATDAGLFVRTGTARVVVPRASVKHAVAFTDDDVSFSNDAINLWFRKRHIPLARLDPSMRVTRFQLDTHTHEYVALVLAAAEALAAVVVDAVEGESEIVVRNMGTFVQSVPNISGLTTTAEGELCYVLNPSDLVAAATVPLHGEFRASEADRRSALAAKRPDTRVILVVDDAVSSRMLNQKLLLASGFQVLTASNGVQALAVLRRQHCDLVVTDVQMPEMDGHELTRRIKQDPKLAAIPVVQVTAMDRREDKERGLDSGADAYLLKQKISQTELVNTIDQLIG